MDEIHRTFRVKFRCTDQLFMWSSIGLIIRIELFTFNELKCWFFKDLSTRYNMIYMVIYQRNNPIKRLNYPIHVLVVDQEYL